MSVYEYEYCNWYDVLVLACAHVSARAVVWAVFISLWGTVFLEFWKREQAKLQYRWNLSDFDAGEEPARPAYMSLRTKKTRPNPITGVRSARFSSHVSTTTQLLHSTRRNWSLMCRSGEVNSRECSLLTLESCSSYEQLLFFSFAYCAFYTVHINHELHGIIHNLRMKLNWNYGILV